MKTPSIASWICAVAAYILWGLLPIYWRLLQGVSPSTILAHRVIWSAVCLSVATILTTRLSKHWDLKKGLLRYSTCAIALSVNWGLYIWAVSNHLLLASSLGYFLAPLLYTLAGVFIWKEPISKYKLFALLLAAIGLVPLLINSDLTTFIIACGLAISIVAYGSLRKGGQLPQLQALTLESVIIAPIALLYILNLANENYSGNLESQDVNLLLFASGPVTLIPLLFFGRAVKELPLNQIGFLQYISPFLQFTVAIFVFNEAVDLYRLCSFFFVWLGILLVCFEAIKKQINKTLST